MTAGEFAQVLTAIGVLGGVVVSWRNGRKLDNQGEKIEAVHRSTNGLSERNEAIAKKLGIAEGTATGLQQGREETR